MPVWHAATRAAREAGELAVLGVVQEQHAERARLFAQWKQLDWPILHDPLNSLGLRGAPVVVAIDEHGIVRDEQLQLQELPPFLSTRFAASNAPAPPPARSRPNVALLEKGASQSQSSEAWRELGDALVNWSVPNRLDAAIRAFGRAHELQPGDASLLFRLGVAHRLRYDSVQRRAGDFSRAVDFWCQALALDPNQYIYRRRIEQYGPRLAKPYPFYTWVLAAREEILARGGAPLTLRVELSLSELSEPSRDRLPSVDPVAEPDQADQITRDAGVFVDVEAVVVPATLLPGEMARVHLELRPTKTAHWNNEAGPLQIWVTPPEGWGVKPQRITFPLPTSAESSEPRQIEFEVRSAPNSDGTIMLSAYALYHICEDAGGSCLYRRQDFEIPVPVSRSVSVSPAR